MELFFILDILDITGIYYQGTYSSKTENRDPGLIAVKDFYNFL